LFDNQYLWNDIDFLVGTESEHYQKLKPANMLWVDIDNIMSSLPSSQVASYWVDVDDIGFHKNSPLLSKANNCWVEIQNIDFPLLPNPFYKQTKTLWVDCEDISLKLFIQSASFQNEVEQIHALDHIQWVDILEVSIPSTTSKSKPLVDLMLRNPDIGTFSLISGKALPPPIWPLPIPKFHPNTRFANKPQAQIPSQVPLLPQKIPNSQEEPNSTKPFSSSSTINPSALKDGSRGRLLPTHLSLSKRSCPGSPIPNFLPAYYGEKNSSRFSISSQNQVKIQPSYKAASPLEVVDLEAQPREENSSPMKQLPVFLPCPKDKYDVVSELQQFPPIWPLPIPETKGVSREPQLLETQMRFLVKRREHEQ
jgi:hypothetical protein